MHVGIVTTPVNKGALTPLLNLMDVLIALSTETTLITANQEDNDFMKERSVTSRNARLIVLNKAFNSKSSAISRVLYYAYLQIMLAYYIIRLNKKIDTYVFFLDAHSLMLPVLAAKLLRKKLYFILAASIKGSKEKNAFINFMITLMDLSERICFYLADHIILYTPGLIEKWGLHRHKSKIIIAHRHFMDINLFNIVTPYHERGPVIGFIGRLNDVKGIINLVEAMPFVLVKYPDYKLVIIGYGRLHNDLEHIIEKKGLKSSVTLKGWVEHDQLPIYLNQFKMLAIPSYPSEGLPNAMLEAMACGTPIVATPVGSIDDVIKDGYNGFLMADNNPATIASNIIRAIEHDNPESIIVNARSRIETEHTFESVIRRYKEIFTSG